MCPAVQGVPKEHLSLARMLSGITAEVMLMLRAMLLPSSHSIFVSARLTWFSAEQDPADCQMMRLCALFCASFSIVAQHMHTTILNASSGWTSHHMKAGHS